LLKSAASNNDGMIWTEYDWILSLTTNGHLRWVSKSAKLRETSSNERMKESLEKRCAT
jgi:hypothetical protein